MNAPFRIRVEGSLKETEFPISVQYGPWEKLVLSKGENIIVLTEGNRAKKVPVHYSDEAQVLQRAEGRESKEYYNLELTSEQYQDFKDQLKGLGNIRHSFEAVLSLEEKQMPAKAIESAWIFISYKGASFFAQATLYETDLAFGVVPENTSLFFQFIDRG